MVFTVDHLKVWQAPKAKQLRPGSLAVLIPHPKQQDPVVNFCIPPKPSAALAAAPCLRRRKSRS
jgi:hypothetical protein